ncbi:MAG: hypothetical protein KF812_12055 [Fimbriimonadaceae bacterium]|nr:hypothetical protein [Fimbriimonadaceae bacterium]
MTIRSDGAHKVLDMQTKYSLSICHITYGPEFGKSALQGAYKSLPSVSGLKKSFIVPDDECESHPEEVTFVMFLIFAGTFKSNISEGLSNPKYSRKYSEISIKSGFSIDMIMNSTEESSRSMLVNNIISGVFAMCEYARDLGLVRTEEFYSVSRELFHSFAEDQNEVVNSVHTESAPRCDESTEYYFQFSSIEGVENFIKHAKRYSVVCSYSPVDGKYYCECSDLISPTLSLELEIRLQQVAKSYGGTYDGFASSEIMD